MGLINYNIEKYSPKQLVIIPLVLLAISLILLALNTASTGMPVTPGIDFSGGTAVNLNTPDSKEQIQATFAGVSAHRYQRRIEQWEIFEIRLDGRCEVPATDCPHQPEVSRMQASTRSVKLSVKPCSTRQSLP